MRRIAGIPDLNVAVVGHFGFGKQLANGQTIKTKIVADELCRQFGEEQVLRIDTHGGIKSLLKAPIQVFGALKRCKHTIILPAQNGLRVLAPLLLLLNPLFCRKLHYVVIGGWLPDFLKTRKRLADILRRFDGIYVETNAMKAALKAQNFANVIVIPNCKQLVILEKDGLTLPAAEPYPLCTFSRVSKEKGIAVAADAVKMVNEKRGRTVYTLDIYGQIDADQTAWFDDLQKHFPAYVRYRGVAPFDKSTEVLKKYSLLLFPTYYAGEGFAGTLLDAFGAGVPVIASDWKYNAEIVEDGVCGLIFPVNDINVLAEKLMWCELHPDEVLRMKKACIDYAQCFLPQNAMKPLLAQLKV